MKRFKASFTADPAVDDEMSWQQFQKTGFDSVEDAASHALAAAQRSIDLDL
ncbi:MAG TPA: hypothetical protein VNU71_05950 [Burkholderiaceae bacterium]|nr:hypothetical protein [Burkholderiaceae bacterium]